MKRIVVLHAADNVATSLAELEVDALVEVSVDGEARRISVRDGIPFGHKLAIRPLAAGEDVLKYGETIGRASRAIEPGEWVHVHNVESVRARGDIA
jgi:altronate dehydratase small subunit